MTICLPIFNETAENIWVYRVPATKALLNIGEQASICDEDQQLPLLKVTNLSFVINPGRKKKLNAEQ